MGFLFFAGFGVRNQSSSSGSICDYANRSDLLSCGRPTPNPAKGSATESLGAVSHLETAVC